MILYNIGYYGKTHPSIKQSNILYIMDKLFLPVKLYRKKALRAAMSLAALLLAFPAEVFAQTNVRVNNISFTLYPETGTAEVAEPTEDEGEYRASVRIPSSVSYGGQS